jgi:cell fate regulator YaaT (PSP1 superfamily)
MKNIATLIIIFISYLNFYSQGFQIDRNLSYFPTKMSRNNSIQPGINGFRADWYSKQLRALKEPIIFSDTSKKEMYRFTWLRTFHNPIAIRIEKENNNYKLYWKLCNGAGGYDPGELIIDKQKKVDKITWGYIFKNTGSN